MVLDSKAMEWGSQHGLDTAALKKANVPIYGKWYFPDLPAGVPLVNLQTGEVERFAPGFKAGAVLYAKEDDLRRAGVGPYAAGGARASVIAGAPAGAAQPAASAPARHAEPEHVAEAAHAAPEADHEDHGHAAHAVEEHHPSSGFYVTIAVILFIVTAVEVAIYYIPALLPVIAPILIVLSVVKFTMVVAFFMHLKFDHRLFTGVFVLGLAIAIALILALMALFTVVQGGAAAAH
ncbi:MAG: cytochrome C oxidase subunit IV family protein [Chloroflexota bacterium]